MVKIPASPNPFQFGMSLAIYINVRIFPLSNIDIERMLARVDIYCLTVAKTYA